MKWNNAPLGKSNCRIKGCKYYNPETKKNIGNDDNDDYEETHFYCKYHKSDLSDHRGWECAKLEVE